MGGRELPRSIEEINWKIEKGKAVVFTAEEMSKFVEENGVKEAYKKVDVVTTGTFGAMCSSGVFLNFGHADPPIKMTRVWLNGVEAFTGLAAVDAYLGAAQISKEYGIRYGGAHVIEDLVRRKPVVLKATAYGTDCYPRKRIKTVITIDDINQAVMCNPRNSYQKYEAATNSSSRVIYTYMGKLLPRYGNVTYSGSGELNPLINDPEYRTIGIGTRIFLAGAVGYIAWNGTQHNPKDKMGTLMVVGNLKEMDPRFLRAASVPGYGSTLYLGIGITIPILDEDLARSTAITDSEIEIDLYDYGIPRRDRPVIKKVTYAELKSGQVEINGRKIRAASLSSFHMARLVARALKDWIEQGRFKLTLPVENLSTTTPYSVMRQVSPSQIKETVLVEDDPQDEYLVWHEDGCIECGLCTSVCPKGVFTLSEESRLVVKKDRCIECGLCGDLCPVGAITLKT